MKLTEVKRLLDDNSYAYTQTVIPSRAEFYRQKGFHPSIDNGAFTLLTISNPNHEKYIQIIFNDATENPDFHDLEFGSFWYELFDCEKEYLAQELLTEIQRIIDGSTYVICASIVKKGIHWNWNGVYYDLPDDEMNSMDVFRNTVSKIKAPKNCWKRLTGKTDIYEIFNWTNYEQIIK